MREGIGPYGILTGVIPTGGWRFPIDPELAGKLKDPHIRAAGYDKLVKAVTVFRIENGLRIGDVEHEVSTFMRRVSPMNDRHPGRTYEPKPEGRDDYHPPIERARNWLVGVGRRKLKRIGDHDAKPRAVTCAGCPHNVKWRTKCEPCNEDVEFRGHNVRQRPKFLMDPLLHFCRLHGIYLPAAIFLDQKELPAKIDDAPAACWLPTDETRPSAST